MKRIKDIIEESLLDDFDRIEGDFLKTVIKDWVEKYVKCTGNVRYLKNGSVKFGGDVLIKGFDGETFPENFKISDVNGDFKIEKCPNLVSISGIFDDYVKIKGSYVVSNCPKLTSLEGSPFNVEGDLSLVSNTSLKSLEGCPKMAWGKIYIMKNGKKFTKNVIKSYIDCKIDDDIFCGVEDEEATVVESENIFEEMNEPHLLLLAKQLKDHPILRGNKSNFNQIFGRPYSMYGRGHSKTYVPFDEIDSSNVKEYKNLDEAQKAARQIISKGNLGLILLMVGDTYVCAIDRAKRGVILDREWGMRKIDYYRWPFRSYGEWTSLEYSQVMELILQVEKVVIISWSREVAQSVQNKQIERTEAQRGMITNTPEQNAKIAAVNYERYKKLAAQIKAQKNAEFSKIDEKVEGIVMKALKVCSKAKMDPEKYEGWQIQTLNEEIYGEQHSRFSHGKRQVQGSNGLLYYYNYYTKYYLKIAKGESDSYDRSYLEDYKRLLLSKIDEIEQIFQRRGW